MKFVFASDSFKGTLTSVQTVGLLTRAAREVFGEVETFGVPVADGGEGTAEAVVAAERGSWIACEVCGPMMDRVVARYGRLDERRAVIEMAQASGLTRVPVGARDPLKATSFGTGELIRHALDQGFTDLSVAIGGSATNDGGVGMLQALGFGLLDENGRQVSFGAQGLQELKSITDDKVIPELKDCSFRIACDVTNPLCGETGCSAIYGPQKGATPSMILQMDRWLRNYAKLAAAYNPKADPEFPGTGAAGGLGFAFLSFTNAVLESGINIVLDETKLEEYVKDADVVITGEGRLDGQTVMGKAPIGVAKIAKKYGKPVIAFAGCVTPDAVACNEHGIDAFFPILRGVVTLQEAMDSANARKNMADTVEQVFRLMKI